MLLEGENQAEIKLNFERDKERGNCAECETTIPLERKLCEDCLKEELKIVEYLKGNLGEIERIECQQCKQMYPVINKHSRYLINPETKICLRCEEKESNT